MREAHEKQKKEINGLHLKVNQKIKVNGHVHLLIKNGILMVYIFLNQNQVNYVQE